MIRVLTAAALVALVVAALYFPPPAFVVVLALFVAVGWGEFAALAAAAGAAPLRGLGGPMAIACAASFAPPFPGTPSLVFGLTALLAAAAGLGAGRHHPGLAVRRVVATIGGLCWLGLLPGFYVALRYDDNGVALIALVIASISSGDIVAYYGGSLLGRHALAPHLSPKKTVEGTVCGLLASAVGGGVVSHFWLPDTPWSSGALLGVVLGTAGQVGDLFESSLKRAAGSKDSSRVLPGHGGILDRIDGLLFGGCVAYVALFFDLI